MFASRLHLLTSKEIKVIIILGNHDSPRTVGRAAPPEVFDELKLAGVYVFSKPSFIDLESRDGLKIRIFALPYRHPIHIAAKVEKAGGEKVELDRDELLRAFQAEIKRNFDIFTKAGRKGAQVGLLAAHLYVEGARRGAERIYIVGEEFAVPSSMIQSEVFDYIALGHVHSHQVLPGKIPIIYAGSLEKIDFSEEDEQKGFMDITYENGLLTWKFIPIETRRMITLEIDCTEAEDANKVIADKIEKIDVKDAIVRLVLIVKPETNIDLDVIHGKLAPTFWHEVNLERKSEKKTVQATSFWSSLNPHETLARYLKSMKLREEEMSLVGKLGDEIVSEVLSEAEKA